MLLDDFADSDVTAAEELLLATIVAAVTTAGAASDAPGKQSAASDEDETKPAVLSSGFEDEVQADEAAVKGAPSLRGFFMMSENLCPLVVDDTSLPQAKFDLGVVTDSEATA